MPFVFFVLFFFSCPRLSPDRSQGFVWCGDPPQEYRWHAKPIVRVCISNKSLWPKVDRALDFWRLHGHEFGTVVRGDKNGSSCNESPTFSITIKEAAFNDSKTRGKTTTRSLGDLILASEVEILYGEIEKDNLVLEHEIGHALGYKHLTCRGHIMHPHTNYLGKGYSGIANKYKFKEMSYFATEKSEEFVCGEK